MANVDFPHGFEPVSHLSGGEIRPRPYVVDATAGIICRGDIVRNMAARNSIDNLAASNADFIQIVGVAAEYHATGGAVSTILVYDDPNIVYRAQCDGTIAQTLFGNQFAVVTTAGNATLQLSQYEIDSSENLISSTGYALTVLGIYPGSVGGQANDIATNAELLCVLNVGKLKAKA